MLECVRLVVFLSIWLIPVANGTISVFRHCDEEIKIQDDAIQKLEISGMHWPLKSYACLVTFRSSGLFDIVYYQFDSFDVNDAGLEISISTSKESSEGFVNQGIYTSTSPPKLVTLETGARYLRFTVTRGHLSDYDLIVRMTIFSKAGAREGSGLKTGQVVGIVVGCVVMLIILITLIICCAIGAKYPDRKGSIYTVARRLSIFTTQLPRGSRGSISQHSEHSDAESEIHPAITVRRGGQMNEGYEQAKIGPQPVITYTSRAGQSTSKGETGTTT